MRAGLCLGLCVAALFVPLRPAHAASFAERMRQAEAQLRAGNGARALEMQRQLLVDYPDAEAVQLGLACAQYAIAERQLRAGDKENAAKAIDRARQGFAALADSAVPAAKKAATYNLANSRAQLALLDAPAPGVSASRETYVASVNSLREVVAAFEGFLEEYPHHARAQQSLDHVRLRLKELVRNMPENQPQDEPEDEQDRQTSRFTDARSTMPGMSTPIGPKGEVVRLVWPGEEQ